MKILFVGIACFSILAFTSCEKDSDDSLTKSEILTANDWQLNGATVDPPVSLNGTPESNLFLFLQECNKDDEWRFEADGSFREIYNVTCGGQGDHFSATWNLNDDESKIIITGSQISEFDLISIEEDKIVVGTDKGYFGQPDYYYTIEYIK